MFGGAPVASAHASSSTQQIYQTRALPAPKHSNKYSPLTCSYWGQDEAYPTVNGANLTLDANIYDCSGNYIVDTIHWHWYGGYSIVLQEWQLYKNCGDWFAVASGFPGVTLSSSSRDYTAAPGQQVNLYNFDIDTAGARAGSVQTVSECF